MGTSTSTFKATCMQPLSITCAVICLNCPIGIPFVGRVIGRAMFLSGKARALARSTLIVRSATLRSSSGLAADSGLNSQMPKDILGDARPHKATSKPRASQGTFEATNTTPDTRNISRTSRKHANLDTYEDRLYRDWVDMEIIPAEPSPFEHMLALPQADWLPVQFVKDPLSFAESSDHIDVATAGICLRLHFCYTNQQARSKEDLRAQLAASQAGTRVLS
jgi:hypothetical protein